MLDNVTTMVYLILLAVVNYLLDSVHFLSLFLVVVIGSLKEFMEFE